MGQAEQSAGLGPKTPAKPSDNGLVRVACHRPALETKPREGGGMQHGPRNNTEHGPAPLSHRGAPTHSSRGAARCEQRDLRYNLNFSLFFT